MKKWNLILLLIIFLSCQKSSKELSGFGGFDINSNFASNQKSAVFRNTMPGEYYCNHLELGNDIGKVSDVSITTDNGKIIDVEFSSNIDTNLSTIQKQLENLKEGGKSEKVETEIAIFTSYSTQKDQIVFVDIEYKKQFLKNGQPKHEFKYSSKKAIDEMDKLIKSMASNER